MSVVVEKQKLTPPEVARRWGVSLAKILSFIRSGELRAISAAAPGHNQRPRYLIDVRDLDDFERRRTVAPAPKLPPRQRRQSEEDYY